MRRIFVPDAATMPTKADVVVVGRRRGMKLPFASV